MSAAVQIKRAVSLLCLAGSALALYNVYGDNGDTLKQAEALACGGKPCVRTLRAERSGLAQSYVFQTSLQPQASKSVRCEREYLVLGAHRCALE